MKFIKKILPRSLYGRFLLIIILPTIIAQAVAVHMFYDRHWKSMSRNMSSALVGEISTIVRIFENNEHSLQQAVIDLGVKVEVLGQPKTQGKHFYTNQQPRFERALRAIIPNVVDITYTQDNQININVKITEDKFLYLKVSSKRLANPTTYIFILWMTGTALLLTTVAVLFLRGQMRSIISLTEVAEKFGKGHDMPAFKPGGAREVRLAAIAFIEMRERIKRLMTRRTQMLAGISHDLRTPLTRMKLQLEMMDSHDGAVKEMKSDTAEMERMLEGYLDFVRGESQEATVDIKLQDFIKEIVAKYRKEDGRIEYNIDDDILVHIKPHNFSRCITNLINNGLRHGSFVCVTAYKFEDDKQVSIFIDDNGQGVPQEEYKKVFQPFYRLDESRNSDTGGIGLGLSIARDIVHRHGGEVKLDRATLGGLRVIITLPL